MNLLEYSFRSCRDLNMDNNWEKDVYDKIVFRAREKIRKALKKNMSQITIKTIYLLRRYGILKAVPIILGNLYSYKKPLWRLSLFHALTNYIFSKTFIERKLGIITTYQIYFPSSGSKKEKEKIINLMKKLNSKSEFPKYLKIYLSFGKNILPTLD